MGVKALTYYTVILTSVKTFTVVITTAVWYAEFVTVSDTHPSLILWVIQDTQSKTMETVVNRSKGSNLLHCCNIYKCKSNYNSNY